MPKQQIKFKYRPQYLSTSQAKWDEGNFDRFAKSLGLPKLQYSELVLEGGNIVDNGVMQPNSSKSWKPRSTEKWPYYQIHDTLQDTLMVLCHL